jgi:Ca2+/Na+ antiporter
VLLTLALIRGGGELATGWASLACIAVLAVINGIIAIAVARPTEAARYARFMS